VCAGDATGDVCAAVSDTDRRRFPTVGRVPGVGAGAGAVAVAACGVAGVGGAAGAGVATKAWVCAAVEKQVAGEVGGRVEGDAHGTAVVAVVVRPPAEAAAAGPACTARTLRGRSSPESCRPDCRGLFRGAAAPAPGAGRAEPVGPPSPVLARFGVGPSKSGGAPRFLLRRGRSGPCASASARAGGAALPSARPGWTSGGPELAFPGRPRRIGAASTSIPRLSISALLRSIFLSRRSSYSTSTSGEGGRSISICSGGPAGWHTASPRPVSAS
jgi:hypothetical protein